MPTRAGWSVLLGGASLIAAGRILGGVEFTVPGVVAIVAVVWAVTVRRLMPSKVAVAKHLSPPMVPAGSPARVDLEVINRSSRRSPLIRLHDAVSGTRGVRLSIASLPGNGGTIRGAYRLPTTRRGVLQLGPIRIDDVDALGLASRSHHVETRLRLIVHPPVELIPVRRVPAGDDPLLGEELRQSLGMSDEEFDGLRPYAPGDDLRRVHWPSSARHDELQVRQFRPPRHGRLVVAIDTRPPGDRTSALDVTTSIAASIATAVLHAGDATRIETTDGRSTPLVVGRRQIDSVLEFLALLENGTDRIHPAIPSSSGTVVAVTADPRVATSMDARQSLARRLQAAIVITVDAANWGNSTDTHSAPGWIHLTGPGQLGQHWTFSRHRSAANA